MTVYSPSQTSEWMRCPMKRALRKEGWIRRFAQKRELAAIIGQSFAAGVGVYNNIRHNHERGGSDATTVDKAKAASAAMGVAEGVFHQHMREIERIGLVLDARDDDYINRMPDRIGRAVAKYIANDPIPPNWRIVGVEYELTQYGRARPDLIVRDELGLAVVDYKTRIELREMYKAKTLQEYQNNDQMLHYAWAIEQEFKEAVQRYQIALCVFEPRFAVDLVPQEINPETLKVWATGRARVWRLMEEEDSGKEVPFLADKHSDQFGQCEYYAACFRYRYDPGLMKQEYINTKDLEDSTSDTGT